MNKLIYGALAGLAAVLMVGCGGSNSITGDNRPKIRFVNATPALGFNVDALLDATTLAQNVAYGIPTTYKRFGNGSRTVYIRQTGSNNTLFTSNPAELFEENKKYTVVSVQGSTGMGALFLQDGDTPTPTINNAKIRVINVANGTGTVDVYLAPTGGALPGAPVISSLAYLGNTTGYVNVPSGQFDLRVTTTGTTTVLLTQGVTIPSQGVLTILVMNNAGGTSPSSYLVLDDRA